MSASRPRRTCSTWSRSSASSSRCASSPSPKHARLGNRIGAAGMALAIVVTLAQAGLEHFVWIDDRRRWRSAPSFGRRRRARGEDDRDAADGGAVQRRRRRRGGARRARGVPQPRRRCRASSHGDVSVAIVLSALIGSISFAGSLVAFAKLQELISGRPITYPGQQFVNLRAARRARRSAARSSPAPRANGCSSALIVGALVFGVLFVLPIGGADMPVVISLLNAFTGLAAAATGFVLHDERADRQRRARRRLGNAADADDGPGDEPLDRQRPLRRVRAGAGGRRRGGALEDGAACARRRPRTWRSCSRYARKVVIVPGYGLAVAQAQHAVRELAD